MQSGQGDEKRQAAPGPVIGLFVASSGLGDRGFMDTIYQGALKAREEHSALLLMEKQPENATPQEEARLLDNLATGGASVVVCSSASMQQAMSIAARKHPGVRFVLMDTLAQAYLPNVSSATFATEQGAFLAGALAAKMSRSKVLGVIAGKRIPPVMDFVIGFQEGARHALPSVDVLVEYIGDHDQETMVWNNPGTAREIAAMLHAREAADILFPVAGASGIGVYNYVAGNEIYAIGVDTDQDYMAPGSILASVLKRMDVALQLLVNKALDDSLVNSNYRFTLADEGVGLSEMRYTREMIPEEVLVYLDALRNDIMSGRIIVPSATAARTGANAK